MEITMNKDAMLDKVYGCLASFAVADALGFPAHDLTQAQIVEKFGGRLDTLRSPYAGNISHVQVEKGRITDDTMMTVMVARALIDPEEPKDVDFFGRKFAEWAKANRLWETNPMFGPTTRGAFAQLINGVDPIVAGTTGIKLQGTSNGSAMRIAPAGLVNPSNIEAAVDLAVAVSLPTHGTQVAIAGAASIAAGVAEALSEDADVFSIASACLRGARLGEEAAQSVARIVPTPNIAARIEIAVMAAIKADDIFEAGQLISDTVGNGLAIYEAVPAAVGLFVAAGGDPWKTMLAGANLGGDTDTIAAIASSLSGALKGFKSVPKDLYEQVESINTLNLAELAGQLVECQK